MKATDRVLQIDAGPGMLLEKLGKRARLLRGTEVSEHAAERARKKGLDVVAVDPDVAALPFIDESFDVVVSDSAVEHRYYPERTIAEARRVLVAGGLLLLLLPNIGHWRHRFWLLFGRFPVVKDGPTDPSHLRFFTVREGKRLARRHGFRVEKVLGFASLWVKDLYPSFFRAPLISGLYRGATRVWPSLFGRDFLLVARKTGP